MCNVQPCPFGLVEIKPPGSEGNKSPSEIVPLSRKYNSTGLIYSISRNMLSDVNEQIRCRTLRLVSIY
jgi:hypothetical protein